MKTLARAKHFWSRLKHTCSLGDGIFAKAKLCVAFFYFTLLAKVGIKSHPWFFTLRKERTTFTVLLETIFELETAKSLFRDEEYAIEGLHDPKTIFDLGANIGLSAIYFKIRYPNAAIYVFEPSPAIFKRLQANLEQFTGISLFNCAVSEKDGVMEFFVDTKSGLSSSLHRRKSEQLSIEVESRSLDSIIIDLKTAEVDLLKFDIEGAELSVFKHCKNMGALKNLVGEVHTDLFDASLEEFLSLFDAFSVDITEIRKNTRFLLKARQKI